MAPFVNQVLQQIQGKNNSCESPIQYNLWLSGRNSTYLTIKLKKMKQNSDMFSSGF